MRARKEVDRPAVPKSERVDLHGVGRVETAGGFTICEVVHPPNFRTKDHAHARAQFSIVRSGTFLEIVSGRTWRYPEGSLLFWPSGAVHRNRTDGESARAIVVQLAPDREREFEALFPLGWKPFLLHRSALEGVTRRLEDEFARRDAMSTLALEGVVLEFLARASRVLARHNPPVWLVAARLHVEKNYRESLDLRRVAAAVGVASGEVARAFRAHYGVSIADAIRKLRIDQASRDLAESARPVGEIALDCGFYDQSHFDREFRRVFKTTPVVFRRRAREAGVSVKSPARRSSSPP